jgi:hypothetical protein
MAAVLAVFISSVQKEYEADRQRAATDETQQAENRYEAASVSSDRRARR